MTSSSRTDQSTITAPAQPWTEDRPSGKGTTPGILARAWHEFSTYVGRMRDFDREDWIVYVSWIGLMSGLVFSTGGFLLAGHLGGVRYPGEAWMVPIGAVIFTLAIAIDTIGHRTVYKEVLKGGEALVHHVTIFCGVGSCVLLCMAWKQRDLFWIPAMVLTVMSFVYSLVDEAFHWKRYSTGVSDKTEMWSHAFIFIGHLTMMIGWWRWWQLGYPGVDATVSLLMGTTP